MNELKIRLKKINSLENRIDSIMLLNSETIDANYFYFTNSEAMGIFTYDFSTPKIFTSMMEVSRANKSWVNKVDTGTLGSLIQTLKNKRIGVDKNSMNIKIFEKISKKVKCSDISQELENARMIKTKYEINCIKNACRISKKIFHKTESYFNRDATEHELKGFIELEMNKHNTERAFPTIVATENNISVPHHIPTNKRLGRTKLIDLGIKYKGYCSDITRTYNSRWEKKILDLINKTEEKIKPGTPVKDLDIFSRKTLGKDAKFFITSLGHGIGINVHERPWIHRKSVDVLEPGMVITIEPGIYVKNGIRIENDYLVTKGGFEKLTDF